MSPGSYRLCLTALAVSTVVTVAACGSSSGASKHSAVVQVDNGEAAKTGPQVIKDAVAAMTAAGAVHITAVGTQGKPAQTLSMDGHVNSDGLMMSMRSAAGEQDFITLGKSAYVRAFQAAGSLSFLPAGLAKQYANRWLKVSGDPSNDSGNSYSSMTFFSTDGSDDGGDATVTGLAKSISTLDKGVTINDKVTKGAFEGQPVVLVTETDGSSFTVAANGPPYLLKAFKVAPKDDPEGGSGTITFSEYGRHFSITAPANAIDINTLLKQPGGAFPTDLPSGFPTDFPTHLPSGFPTDFPTDIPSS